MYSQFSKVEFWAKRLKSDYQDVSECLDVAL